MARRGKLFLPVFLGLALLFAVSAQAGCGKRSAPADAPGPAAPGDGAIVSQGIPVHGYRVIASYPHDTENFTEGLDYVGGLLYEGTGLYGKSKLTVSDLATGRVEAELSLAPEYFGEGVTVLGDEVFQLTYTSRLGFVYDRESLETARTFAYPTEGWGLTDDGERLIMSDGTSTLFFLDPQSGAETGRLTVTDGGSPVDALNELEYIDGEIYANVWMTERIAVISPRTGEVKAWIDLAGLNPDPSQLTGEYVLNGIARGPESGRILVTGKCWPSIFEIEILP